MKIATVSDLHVMRWKDNPTLPWSLENDFGLAKARKAALLDVDVLYFGGDGADPKEDQPQRGIKGITALLEVLTTSPAPTKLWTLGNNDLELLRRSKLTDHYDKMQELVGRYGFHLLDGSPKIMDDIAFAGNVGWYDGTLWWKFEGETKFPNDAESIGKKALDYFLSKEHVDRLPAGLTPDDFYTHCRQRLREHLDQVHADVSVKAVVIGTHMVPSKAFVKGDNPEFAFLNWYMGAEGLADHFQWEKVILGFTGHTHRSDSHQVGKTMVHNLSGPNQPRVFEIRRMDGGSYTSMVVSGRSE